MASKSLSDDQEKVIAYVAEKDDWDINRLRRAVMSKMFDGTSFHRALPLVLKEADRPPDPPVVIDEARKKELQDIVSRFQQQRAVKARLLAAGGPRELRQKPEIGGKNAN